MQGDVHEDETVSLKEEADGMFNSSGSVRSRIGVARGRLKSPEELDRYNDEIRILFEADADSEC
jgi:hypothetical protein